MAEFTHCCGISEIGDFNRARGKFNDKDDDYRAPTVADMVRYIKAQEDDEGSTAYIATTSEAQKVAADGLLTRGYTAVGRFQGQSGPITLWFRNTGKKRARG